jgi:hypothetical protein
MWSDLLENATLLTDSSTGEFINGINMIPRSPKIAEIPCIVLVAIVAPNALLLALLRGDA